MLREDTIYLRMSSHHDLVDDATFLEILSLAEEWNRHPFDTYTDMAMRGRPRPVTSALLIQELHSRVGAGLHQMLRFKVGAESGPVASFEFSADAHPYTGTFHTQIDLRVRKAWLERNLETAPKVLRNRFGEIATMAQPFQGHVHDTDDNSIQNIASAGLLLRGFGVEVGDTVDLATNPGRELSRGEFRYVVNWLTLFGPAMLERLNIETVLSIPEGVLEEIDNDGAARQTPGQQVAQRMGATFPDKPVSTYLLQLGPTPVPFEPQRRAQRAVRAHLRLAELAEAEKWPLGYWQKKK